MNKIMKKNYKTKKLMGLLIAWMTMTALLTGCSSADDATTNEEKNSSTNASAETKPVETQETAPAEESSEPETNEAEPEAETEAEPEPESTSEEPAPEPVVYEGIDMESTLPGAEWVATFEGIINEPKMVIFNDSTNKKVIVENGQTVDFAVDDTFGIYIPDSIELKNVQDELFDCFTTCDIVSNVTKYYKLSKRYDVGDVIDVTNIYEANGTEIEFSVTLNLVE